MRDPAAFLHARLNELEADALESKNAPEGSLRFLDADRWTEALSWQADEDLVLRRVAAMRAIVDAYVHADGDSPRDRDRGRWDALNEAVRHLAAVDSDHPDYDPAWKP